jgi:hypothetical protein
MWIEELNPLNEAAGHKHSERNEVQPCQRFRQPLVVASQPAETSSTGKAALHYSPPGQQHEPSLSTRQLNYLQPYAFCFISFRRLLTCVAGIYTISRKLCTIC